MDWQVGKSMMVCLDAALQKQYFMDVYFTFSQGETTKRLGGHRLILALRSPVFEAMFYGTLADKSEEIEIADIPPSAFKLMLRYIYRDTVDLNDQDVFGVLRASNKYCLPELTELCSTYLIDNSTTQTICEVFEQASLYGVKKLQHHCLVFIDSYPCDIFKTEGFHCLSHLSLERILAGNTLQVDEIHIYRSLENWITAECKRQSLDVMVLQNRRSVAGSLYQLIRFPIMSHRQFSDEVAGKCPRLLENDEIVKLFRFFAGSSDHGVEQYFQTVPRRKDITLKASRFEGEGRSRFWYQGIEDKFTFTCDREMVLTGIHMVGSIQRCGCSAYLKGSVEIQDRNTEEQRTLCTMPFIHEKKAPPPDEKSKEAFHDIDINFEPISVLSGATYGVCVKVMPNYQDCQCNEICDCYDIVSSRKPNTEFSSDDNITRFVNQGEGIVKALLLNYWR